MVFKLSFQRQFWNTWWVRFRLATLSRCRFDHFNNYFNKQPPSRTRTHNLSYFQWYAGDFLCRVCKFFHTFGFYLNSFVICCIAIDRVFGTYNLRQLLLFKTAQQFNFSSLKASHRSYLRCRRMLLLAWICAFCFSLPQSFVFRVFEPPGMKNFK